jgi:hypothetical protein
VSRFTFCDSIINKMAGTPEVSLGNTEDPTLKIIVAGGCNAYFHERRFYDVGR